MFRDAVLLIDAENVFSSINRKVIMLHDLNFICPIIASCIINCYVTPSRLFIVGEGEMDNSRRPNSYENICMSHQIPT